jgi:hypothetical protein
LRVRGGGLRLALLRGEPTTASSVSSNSLRSVFGAAPGPDCWARCRGRTVNRFRIIAVLWCEWCPKTWLDHSAALDSRAGLRESRRAGAIDSQIGKEIREDMSEDQRRRDAKRAWRDRERQKLFSPFLCRTPICATSSSISIEVALSAITRCASPRPEATGTAELADTGSKALSPRSLQRPAMRSIVLPHHWSSPPTP